MPKTLEQLQKERSDLFAKGQQIVQDMEKITAKQAAEEDGEKQKALGEALKIKSDEFEETKGLIDVKDKEIARAEFLAKELADSQPIPNADLSGKDQAGTAFDTNGGIVRAGGEDPERGQHEAMLQWFTNPKTLSDRQYDLVRVNSKQFSSQAAENGIRVPMRVAERMLGPKFAFAHSDVSMAQWLDFQAKMQEAKVAQLQGKAIPMTSADAQRASLTWTDYRAQVLQLPPEPPTLLDRVTIVPSTMGSVQWPRLVQTDANEYGGVIMQTTTEAENKPPTDPTFDSVTISTEEVAGYTEVSETLKRRTPIALEQYIIDLFGGALRNELSYRIMVGATAILGIVPTAGIRIVNRTAAGAVNHADCVNLKFALRSNHRAVGVYLTQDAVLGSLEIQYDTQGRPLWSASFAQGIEDTIAGKPFVSTHRLPALGQPGDVVFCDPKQYILVMEQDVVIARSDDYQFRANRIAYKAYVVAGGLFALPRAAARLDNQVS